MKLSSILKVFTSSFYTPYPYILKYVWDSSNLDRQRLVVVKNFRYTSATKNTTEGIRFEIINGSLTNQNVTTQPFVIKVINKNNLNLYSFLFINFYEIDEVTGSLAFKDQILFYSTTSSEQIFSKTISGKNILITLESPEGRVLYTSQDLQKGLIPVRQDLFVKLVLGTSETYLPIFYSEIFDEVFVFKNYRTTDQKYVSSSSIRTFENANLCDSSPTNVIGDLSTGTIKDYLFSLGYYVTNRQKNYIKGATLSLLEFLYDFYNTSKLDNFSLPDISSFQRYGDFYYSSYYVDLDTFIPQPSEYSIDIRNEIISLFVVSFILDSLSTYYVNKFNSKINFLLSNFGILPEKYMTLTGAQIGGQKLFTNLLYLQTLRNIGSSNYSSLKSLIKTSFLDNNILELNAPTEDQNYISTTQSGVEAYIIKLLLAKHFDSVEYQNILPTLDAIITSKSVLIGALNKNTDPLSEDYNPYFQITLDNARTFYMHGNYVPFGLNALLFKMLGFNFPSELYTEQGLIGNNKHNPEQMVFILPELFSSMIYLATKNFYFSNVQFSQPEEETQIVFVDAKVYGDILEVKILLNIPKKIYGILLDKNTNYVYKLEFSPISSLSHTLVFPVSGLNFSNAKLAFILA
jgi:DNA-binding ferritin-like protein (Dps family)